MYSAEIEQLLKEHNYAVDRYTCMKIIDPGESIQITEIKYFAADMKEVKQL